MSLTDRHWKMRPDNEKALELAQREIAVFVYDALNLEDIDISLPDETRVSSHRTSDQQLIINQGNAWRYLFDSIKQKKFTADQEYACKLHAIAAKEEALEWGAFRSGGVSIAGTEIQFNMPMFTAYASAWAILKLTKPSASVSIYYYSACRLCAIITAAAKGVV